MKLSNLQTSFLSAVSPARTSTAQLQSSPFSFVSSPSYTSTKENETNLSERN